MTPISKPVVNADLARLNGLQRVAECFRYVLLYIEWWISPEGTIRSWGRRNIRVCAWLLIPTMIVLPIIGLTLWQLAFWCTLLTGVVGKLLLIVLLFVGLRLSKR